MHAAPGARFIKTQEWQQMTDKNQPAVESDGLPPSASGAGTGTEKGRADLHIKWRLTVPAAILDQEWRL